MDGVMWIGERHRKLQQGRSGAIYCAMNRAATKRALVLYEFKTYQRISRHRLTAF